MPDFISLFLEEIRRKKDKLLAILNWNNINEESFGRYFESHWHSFSEQEFNLPSFAVDASQRVLSLSFGPYLIISQGLILGRNNYEDAKVNIEALSGSLSQNQLEHISDIILQDIEMELALKVLEREKPPYVLFIDGSLSARISHIIYLLSLDLGDYNFLTFEVLEKTLRLIKLSKEKRIYLISISKISRDTFLSQIILESQGKTIESKYYPTDTELISLIIPHKAGFSTPILLGGKRSLGKKQMEIIESKPHIKKLLEDITAFVNLYLRLIPNDSPIRVDFPCYLIEREDSFLSLDYQILPQADLRDIISLIRNNCAGINVYQTNLYLVDRLVRIKRTPDLERYRFILEKELGKVLPLDRSQRRFF
ncbi:MAG: DNA double-strand break repair nuclease NurA [Dictyoglomaceae bacterium]|nr:DNA double-strand break repair nuclease NurA [Dictyoglomaceae bacterium]